MNLGIDFPSEEIETFYQFLRTTNPEYRESWAQLHELIGWGGEESGDPTEDQEAFLKTVWSIENQVAKAMWSLVVTLFRNAERKPWMRQMMQTSEGSVLLFVGMLEMDKEGESIIHAN